MVGRCFLGDVRSGTRRQALQNEHMSFCIKKRQGAPHNFRNLFTPISQPNSTSRPLFFYGRSCCSDTQNGRNEQENHTVTKEVMTSIRFRMHSNDEVSVNVSLMSMGTLNCVLSFAVLFNIFRIASFLKYSPQHCRKINIF
jgi:hypothetical protein